jgi:hypothetical protein
MRSSRSWGRSRPPNTRRTVGGASCRLFVWPDGNWRRARLKHAEPRFPEPPLRLALREGERPLLGHAHRGSGLASGQRPARARPQRGAGRRRAGLAARSTCRPCCDQTHRCPRPRRNRCVAGRHPAPTLPESMCGGSSPVAGSPGVDRPVAGLLRLPGPLTHGSAVQPRGSADPPSPRSSDGSGLRTAQRCGTAPATGTILSPAQRGD